MSEGATRVLETLREAGGRPCSGGDLAESLGVSRAQVWKHVETLRRRGYEIVGTPGGGYQLASVPDRLYPEEIQRGLATRWLAREIEWLDSTDSTNRVAGERARAGARHGYAVVAEGQTAGRGRLGRSFFSPPYLNLYTSLVLRPSLSLAEAPTTILAAAVAVAETVAEVAGDPAAVEVKWPNDVLLGGRKTSGILMELAAEATRVGHLVLGIGVNLNVDRATFPEEFRAAATSLASELGRPVPRADFTRRLFGTLEDVLDVHAERGFAALRPRWDRFYRMAGRPVVVSEPGGARLEGVALEAEPDGALAVRRGDGAVVRVLAGDVTLSPQARSPGVSESVLLAVDVGNTNVLFGLFDYAADKAALAQHWRIATRREQTSDELGVLVRALFEQAGRGVAEVTDVILSTVVPPLLPIWERACGKLFARPPLVVGPGIRTGMPIRYENPREVGADRIVNAVAAVELVGAPVIAVDFGTATTFDCVSDRGEYLGGAIFPGIHVAMEALFDRASMLHRIEIVRPRTVIGRTTTQSLQSGLLFGYAGMVDAMVERIRVELGASARVVATGGLAQLIASETQCIERVEPFLTLEGLRLLFEKNRPEREVPRKEK